MGVRRLFFAAVGTAVSEAGLAGLEFEFLAADYAGFGGIRHISMIQGRIGNAQVGQQRQLSPTAWKATGVTSREWEIRIVQSPVALVKGR